MTNRTRSTSVASARLVPGQEYRVLSVRPPWAWSIIFAGKDVENRSWDTPYRGPLLIHASSHRASPGDLTAFRSEIASSSGMPMSSVPSDFPRSAILGVVDLVDIVHGARSPWANLGDRHWVLRNPRALEAPVQGVNGKLKLWRWVWPGEARSNGRQTKASIAELVAEGAAHETEAMSGVEPERRGRSIEDVGAEEVMAALRALASSTPANDVELMRAVSRRLGFARMGARVEAGLRVHIRRAVRAGALAREGKALRRVS